MDLVVGLYNDGVASRYVFPDQDTSKHAVVDEQTTFVIPSGSRTWMQPFSLVLMRASIMLTKMAFLINLKRNGASTHSSALQKIVSGCLYQKPIFPDLMPLPDCMLVGATVRRGDLHVICRKWTNNIFRKINKGKNRSLSFPFLFSFCYDACCGMSVKTTS